MLVSGEGLAGTPPVFCKGFWGVCSIEEGVGGFGNDRIIQFQLSCHGQELFPPDHFYLALNTSRDWKTQTQQYPQSQGTRDKDSPLPIPYHSYAGICRVVGASQHQGWEMMWKIIMQQDLPIINMETEEFSECVTSIESKMPGLQSCPVQ